jgi:hypothetical protein
MHFSMPTEGTVRAELGDTRAWEASVAATLHVHMPGKKNWFLLTKPSGFDVLPLS